MLEVNEIKIDRNNKAVIKYEQAFEKGLQSLSEEQRQKFYSKLSTPDINSKPLLKALKKDKNVVHRMIKNIIRSLHLS